MNFILIQCVLATYGSQCNSVIFPTLHAQGYPKVEGGLTMTTSTGLQSLDYVGHCPLAEAYLT